MNLVLSLLQLICMAIAVFLLVGCGSSSVVVPEASAIVLTPPDTTIRTGPAPLPRVGAQTLPERVAEYRRPDTLSTSAEVTAIVAIRDHITIRTRSGEQTFRQPATGETLVLSADSTGGAFVGAVAGKQQKVVIPIERPSLLDQLTRFAYALAGLALVLLVVLIIYRIHR